MAWFLVPPAWGKAEVHGIEGIELTARESD